MKRYSLSFFACLAVALAVTPEGPGPAPASKGLAALVPAGSLLYLEARDFASLVRDWNTSSEKPRWLKSDNYQVFSRSRLFLRLKEAQGEFAAAAGFPPDMSLVESVAGGESALALYDIGNLEFLYITRLPSARAMETVPGRAREKFEPRSAAELPYYVRTEPSKHRVVAFATTDNYLLLATREDLLAGALTLLAGKAGPTLKDEKWFGDAVRAAGPAGDLRLALNMRAVVRAPHFRSYWVQRNISDLRQYEAAIADVHRSSTEIREERVLLRSKQDEAPNAPASETISAKEAALTEVLRLVPDDSGLYRAWADPTSGEALELLERKVLAPRLGRGVAASYAPTVSLSEGQVGNEGDLETRIDVPPLGNTGGALCSEALRRLLEGKKLEAALQLQSSRGLPGGVFVGTESAIVLSASTAWDGEAARAALLAAVESLWTTSRLGANWLERRKGAATFHELNGLAPLAVATPGRFLIVANASELLLAVLSRMSNAPEAQGGVYAAGFRHARERENLVRMVRLIETPFAQRLGAEQEPGGHTPLFFSENLASLSQALARMESESIVVHDRGPVVLQTVTYRWSR
jgi:hypothetical protein